MAEQTKTLVQLHKKGDANALIFAKARAEGVELANGQTLEQYIPTLENKIEVIKKGNDALVIQDGRTVILPDFYSKTEADARFLQEHQDISGKANVEDVYTKEQADARFLQEHQDISGKANASDVYTKTEIDGKLSGAMHFCGTVAKVSELPTGATKGDMYNVESTGANYAWDGNAWDKLSENVDLSGLYTKEESDARFLQAKDITNKVDKATTLEGYGITDAYTKAQADGKFLQASDIANKADKATTLEGYGIGDAYTKGECDAKFLTEHQDISGKANANEVYSITAADAKFATIDDVDGLDFLGYSVIKTL